MVRKRGPLNNEIFKNLNTFHLRCLRSIIGISWKDKWSNAKVLQTCHLHSISYLVGYARLRWLGHLARLGDHRMPKQILFGKLAVPRKSGKPLLRWSDCVSRDLKNACIPEDSWLDRAQNLAEWKDTIRTGLSRWGATSLLAPRHEAGLIAAPGSFSCSAVGCQRTFASHRGLAQHVRQIHKLPSDGPLTAVKNADCPAGSVSLADMFPSALKTASNVASSFSCSVCGKICKNKSGLTRHSNSHNVKPVNLPISTVTFVCDLCGKTCSNKSGLSRHRIKWSIASSVPTVPSF